MLLYVSVLLYYCTAVEQSRDTAGEVLAAGAADQRDSARKRLWHCERTAAVCLQAAASCRRVLCHAAEQ